MKRNRKGWIVGALVFLAAGVAYAVTESRGVDKRPPRASGLQPRETSAASETWPA
jgi:hypothetical protein